MSHRATDPRQAKNARTAGPAKRAVGRGSQIDPANRFDSVHFDPEESQCADAADLDRGDEAASEQTAEGGRRIPTQLLPDDSKSLLSSNDSPDIGFRWSMNPYRGCEHGCAYCYARPSHEYLGFNAGLDFETKILVKHHAADLLRNELARPSWSGELICLSGNTDCYQPAERDLALTRACLAVMLEARQCVGVITKNALVLRDLDLLSALAERRLVHLQISLTTLNTRLCRSMEPRTSSPAARLEAIRQLSQAGIPVRVMTAPMIPGLNDEELPSLLTAAREAGAQAASYTLLRLPLTVRPVFMEWLERSEPLRAERVKTLIRSTRGGKDNDSRFGNRMRGEGEYAEQVAKTFRVLTRRLGLDRPMPPLDFTQFRHPQPTSGQMRLFD